MPSTTLQRLLSGCMLAAAATALPLAGLTGCEDDTTDVDYEEQQGVADDALGEGEEPIAADENEDLGQQAEQADAETLQLQQQQLRSDLERALTAVEEGEQGAAQDLEQLITAIERTAQQAPSETQEALNDIAQELRQLRQQLSEGTQVTAAQVQTARQRITQKLNQIQQQTGGSQPGQAQEPSENPNTGDSTGNNSGGSSGGNQ